MSVMSTTNQSITKPGKHKMKRVLKGKKGWKDHCHPKELHSHADTGQLTIQCCFIPVCYNHTYLKVSVSERIQPNLSLAAMLSHLNWETEMYCLILV